MGRKPKALGGLWSKGLFRTKEYTVVAYGVQTTILNIDDQTKAIAEIYSQNPRLEDRVRVVRIGGAKNDAGKQLGPLYIGVTEQSKQTT